MPTNMCCAHGGEETWSHTSRNNKNSRINKGSFFLSLLFLLCVVCVCVVVYQLNWGVIGVARKERFFRLFKNVGKHLLLWLFYWCPSRPPTAAGLSVCVCVYIQIDVVCVCTGRPTQHTPPLISLLWYDAQHQNKTNIPLEQLGLLKRATDRYLK